MEHLREMWKTAAAPVRGMPLADLFASTKPTLEIRIICKKASPYGRNNGPYAFSGAIVAFERPPSDLMAEIKKLEQDARRSAESSDSAKVIENMGGIERITLIGSGSGAPRVLLAEKRDWGSPWGAPTKNVAAEYSPIEPMKTFFNHMNYGSKEELMRLFVVDVAGGVYDDRQFADVEEGKKLTVYRGISLAPNTDPTSSNKDGQGTGSSWTMIEETAMAIAERGQAGFEGDNKLRNDVFWIRVRDTKTAAVTLGATVPTVLRAEVIITPDGASPYRPWSDKYISEKEIDIPRGQQFTLTGWKQATAKPVNDGEKRKAEDAYELSVKLEREKKLDDPAWIEGRQAGYYVRWQWGSWKSVNVKRTASGVPDITREQITEILDAAEEAWGGFERAYDGYPEFRLLLGAAPGSMGAAESYAALAKALGRKTASSGDLEDLISEAEYAMERGGYAGKAIIVPVGRDGDPDYEQAMAPLREMVSKIVGRRIHFYASDSVLDDGGGNQAQTDGMTYIAVRPTTNLLTILHEAAHIRCGKLGHGRTFVFEFRSLIKEHLGQRAASRFWQQVGAEAEALADGPKWFTV